MIENKPRLRPISPDADLTGRRLLLKVFPIEFTCSYCGAVFGSNPCPEQMVTVLEHRTGVVFCSNCNLSYNLPQEGWWKLDILGNLGMCIVVPYTMLFELEE